MELSTLMDAWGILTSGSTIANGDAWEHLQAQGGGETVVYVTSIDGQLSALNMVAESIDFIASGDVGNTTLAMSIEDKPLIITAQQIDLQGSITPQTLGGEI